MIMNIEVFHLNNTNNKNNSDQFWYWCLTLYHCISRMDSADDKIFPVLRKIRTCIFVFVKLSAEET